MKSTQEVIKQPVKHESAGYSYPDSHDPVCDRGFCNGCDEMISRRARNHRAGKSVGVAVRGATPDQPVRGCSVCKAPVYAGMTETQQVPVWAWNMNIDRASWALEAREGVAAPPLCPSCRAANS